MQAYMIETAGNLDALGLVDKEDPEPGPYDVLIQMRAASLNFRDLMVLEGVYPDMVLPLIPGSDGIGEILAVGEGVTRFSPGDRVAGVFYPDWIHPPQPEQVHSLGGQIDGVLAQRVVLPESGVVHVPEHLSDEEAATLPCAAVTAWNALMVKDDITPSSTVLIQGTGGVALFALQFAHMAGARSIVITSSAEKLALAQSLGADHVINYREVEDWDREVLRLTDGVGVDSVIEIGGEKTLERSIQATRKGGSIHLIGLATGFNAKFFLPAVLMKQIRLQGIRVGSRSMFEDMNKAIALHKIKPVIDKVFPFEQTKEAYDYLQHGGHSGKVCIRF